VAERARWGEGEVASVPVVSAVEEGVAWRWRARMVATWRRVSDAVGRARCCRRWREGGGRWHAGEARPLRCLGQLVGTGLAVNSAPSFFNFFFPKSLNENFECLAKLFRAWSKNRKCSK